MIRENDAKQNISYSKKLSLFKASNLHLLSPQLYSPEIDNYNYYTNLMETLQELVTSNKYSEVHNIALSGDHGVGKSSLIQTLKSALDHNDDEDNTEKVLVISALPKGFGQQKKANTKKVGSGQEIGNEQKYLETEILKHILYKISPSKLPKSKFHRESGDDSSSKKLSMSICLLILGVLSLIFHKSISSVCGLHIPQVLIDFLPILFSIALILCSAYSIFLIALKSGQLIELSADKYSLKLSNSGNAAIFDEFLNEILYFFEMANYTCVVFEDSDRFEDISIIDKLRQLNTILNQSEQINRKITFIYTIKDSFIPNAEDRTKLFDVIIPLLPFSSSRNSLGHVQKCCKDLEKINPIYKVSPSVQSLLAKNTNNIRIIYDIFNEYLIMGANILWNAAENNIEADIVSADKLFVMTMIKVLEPETFQDAAYGSGILANVQKAVMEYITNEVKKIDNGTQYKASLEEITSNLQEYILGKIPGSIEKESLYYALNGTDYSPNDLSIWDHITSDSDGGIQVKFKTVPNYPYNDSPTQKTSLIEVDEFIKNTEYKSLGSIPSEIKNKWQRQRRELLQNDLFQYYALNHEKINTYLEKQGKKRPKPSSLINSVLQSGFIDGNYQSYTSLEVQSIESERTRRYIAKYVNSTPKFPNIQYKFTDDEVDYIVNYIKGREGEYKLGLLNISIITKLLKDNQFCEFKELFDYILEHHPDQIQTFFSELFASNVQKNVKKEIFKALISHNYIEKNCVDLILRQNTKDAAELLNLYIDTCIDEKSTPPSAIISDRLISTVILALEKNDLRTNIYNFMQNNSLLLNNIGLIKNIGTQKEIIQNKLFSLSKDNINLLPNETIFTYIDNHPDMQPNEIKTILSALPTNSEISEKLLTISPILNKLTEDEKDACVSNIATGTFGNSIPVDTIRALVGDASPKRKQGLSAIIAASDVINDKRSLIEALEALESTKYLKLINGQWPRIKTSEPRSKELLDKCKQYGLITSYNKNGQYWSISHKNTK